MAVTRKIAVSRVGAEVSRGIVTRDYDVSNPGNRISLARS